MTKINEHLCLYHPGAIVDKDVQLEQANKQIQKLVAEVEAKNEQIKKLVAKNAAQRKQVQKLVAENDALKLQAQMPSQNLAAQANAPKPQM